MLFRFPPTPAEAADPSFLTFDTATYAKYKRVNRSGTRNVFLTEHTLVFTISGTKLLHLPDHVLHIGPGSVVLLKRGICYRKNPKILHSSCKRICSSR